MRPSGLLDTLSTLGYGLRSSLFSAFEELQVRRRFYRDPRFKALDRSFATLPYNPYRVAEAFPYGETPLTTLWEIARRSGLSAEDSFLDAGCGRGRGVFFLAHFFGCQGVGIDHSELFVQEATSLKERLGVEGVRFLRGDFCQNLERFALTPTWVYLYGSALCDEKIALFTEALQKLPQKTKIISVSYPLKGFRELKVFEASFPWGKTDIYIQEKLWP